MLIIYILIALLIIGALVYFPCSLVFKRMLKATGYAVHPNLRCEKCKRKLILVSAPFFEHYGGYTDFDANNLMHCFWCDWNTDYFEQQGLRK